MIVKENCKEIIKSPSDVYDIMKPIFDARQETEKHKEYFYMMGLDSMNRIKIIDLIAFGSVNECSCYPREIFKIALLKDCISIVVIHNHPSGNLEASLEDKQMTEKIKEGCKILSIKFLDHVIVGENNYSSFK